MRIQIDRPLRLQLGADLSVFVGVAMDVDVKVVGIVASVPLPDAEVLTGGTSGAHRENTRRQQLRRCYKNCIHLLASIDGPLRMAVTEHRLLCYRRVAFTILPAAWGCAHWAVDCRTSLRTLATWPAVTASARLPQALRM